MTETAQLPELLTRGVEQVVPGAAALAQVMAQKKIRVPQVRF